MVFFQYVCDKSVIRALLLCMYLKLTIILRLDWPVQLYTSRMRWQSCWKFQARATNWLAGWLAGQPQKSVSVSFQTTHYSVIHSVGRKSGTGMFPLRTNQPERWTQKGFSAWAGQLVEAKEFIHQLTTGSPRPLPSVVEFTPSISLKPRRAKRRWPGIHSTCVLHDGTRWTWGRVERSGWCRSFDHGNKTFFFALFSVLCPSPDPALFVQKTQEKEGRRSL